MSDKQCESCEVERARAEVFHGAVIALEKLQSKLQPLKQTYEIYKDSMEPNNATHVLVAQEQANITLFNIWQDLKALFEDKDENE